MLGINANNAHDAFALDYLAFIAHGLDTGSYFHINPQKYPLKVSRPQLAFFHETVMIVHFKLRFNLAHRVKVNANKNQ